MNIIDNFLIKSVENNNTKNIKFALILYNMLNGFSKFFPRISIFKNTRSYDTNNNQALNQALGHAAKKLNDKVMNSYIKQRADVNFIDEHGRSALDHVAESIAKSKNVSVPAIAQEIESSDIVCKLAKRGARYSAYKHIMIDHITNSPYKGFPYSADEGIDDSQQSKTESTTLSRMYAYTENTFAVSISIKL